jgi:hypothetical protein
MKIWVKLFQRIMVVFAVSLLASCQVPSLREVIFEDKMTQLQIRSIRSRTFELSDRIKAMRAVITTLQDLDFVIDQADSRLGIITATKLQIYHLHNTVKVDDRSSGRILVRIQLSAGINPGVEAVYQEFFVSLEKNFFLTAHFVPLPKSFAPEEPSELIETPTPNLKYDNLSLRKQPEENLREIKIKAMLSKYGFFDSQLNPDSAYDNHFIDNQNGTITDQATGLMWQKSGSQAVLRKHHAAGYVNKINKQKFAGYSDWRLPTIEELASLLSKTEMRSLHIDTAFEEKQKFCWSSDKKVNPNIGHRHEGWVINFDRGKITLARWSTLHQAVYGGWEKGFNTHNYVRAVRTVK